MTTNKAITSVIELARTVISVHQYRTRKGKEQSQKSHDITATPTTWIGYCGRIGGAALGAVAGIACSSGGPKAALPAAIWGAYAGYTLGAEADVAIEQRLARRVTSSTAIA